MKYNVVTVPQSEYDKADKDLNYNPVETVIDTIEADTYRKALNILNRGIRDLKYHHSAELVKIEE